MRLSVQDISAMGGPSPAIGETKAGYYNRVASWASQTGKSIGWDSEGYPISNGGGVGVATVVRTGMPATNGYAPTALGELDVAMGVTPTFGMNILALIAGGKAIFDLLTGSPAPSELAADTSVVQTNGTVAVDGVVLKGPGVPEPDNAIVVKRWQTKYQRRDGRDGLVYYWLIQDGRIICWNNLTNQARIWKPKKPIGVIMQGSNMRMKDYLRISRYLDKFTRRLAKSSKRLKLQ